MIIIGDAGAAHRLLTGRSEVDVRIALTVADAARMVCELTVATCIVSEPHVERNGELQDLPAFLDLAQASGVATILLTARDEVVLPVDPLTLIHRAAPQDVTTVLGLVEQLCGLRFARHLRAPLHVPVAVGLDDRRWVCESIDISQSGISLRNFPLFALGTYVYLELSVGGDWMRVEAKLMRYFYIEGKRMAGLELLGLSSTQQSRIESLVERWVFAPPPSRGSRETKNLRWQPAPAAPTLEASR